MTKRIWELDALRGICILGMVAVHGIYDLGSPRLTGSAAYILVKDWGGVLFLLLSGICVTLGNHWLRRGITVFACGMVCTAVTWGIYALGLAPKSIVIVFGVLHCLGLCMVLWSVTGKLPLWGLTALGAAAAAAGLMLPPGIPVTFPWLIPLGLPPEDFASADYFPLLPNLGFFLLGAALGRSCYRGKRSLLPNALGESAPIRFLCACGRHSLTVYLLHQPVILGLTAAFTRLHP